MSHDLLYMFARCAFYFHLHIICHPHILVVILSHFTSQAWETALGPRFLLNVASSLSIADKHKSQFFIGLYKHV